MPARITVRAELASLLAKSQGTTDANRQAQLKKEADARADRKRLEAKKDKEDAARKKRQDDPVGRNIFTAAMGQQQLAFALIPAAELDASVTGPFGEDDSGFADLNWFGKGGTAAGSLARGYINRLWGSVYSITSISSAEAFPTRRPIIIDGAYSPVVEYKPTPPDGDVTWAEFILGHLVAGTTDGRFQYNSESGRYTTPDGQGLPSVSSGSNSYTLEAIFRLGRVMDNLSGESPVLCLFDLSLTGWGGADSLSSTESEQYSTGFQVFTGSTGNWTAWLGTSLDNEGGEFINEEIYPTDLSLGQELHVAVVGSDDVTRGYINGVLRAERPTLAVNRLHRSRGMVATAQLRDSGALAGGPGPPAFDYIGPSLLKGVRYTSRAIYSGASFTPPTAFTGLA